MTMTTTKIRRKEDTVNMKTAYYLTSLNFSLINVCIKIPANRWRFGEDTFCWLHYIIMAWAIVSK